MNIQWHQFCQQSTQKLQIQSKLLVYYILMVLSLCVSMKLTLLSLIEITVTLIRVYCQSVENSVGQ